MRFALLFVLAAALGSGAAALTAGPDSRPAASVTKDRSLWGVISSREDLSSARDLLALSGLQKRLRGGGPYTLLLPVNSSISRGLSDFLARPSNQRTLRKVMRLHVLTGRRRYLTGGTAPKTLAGERVPVRVYRSQGWVGDTRLIGLPLRASNGYIFLIEDLLTPRGFSAGL